MQNRERKIGIAVVVLAAVLAGITNVLTPFSYRAGATPLTLMALRYPIFLLICWLVLTVTRSPARLTRQTRFKAYIGGLFYWFGSGGLLIAFAYIPASLAVLVFFTFPIITIFLESLLDGSPPGLFLLACTGLAFGGLLVAMNVEAGLDPRGIALAFGAALAIACSYIWADRQLNGINPTHVTFHMGVICLIISVIAVFGFDQFQIPEVGNAGFYALLAAVIGFSGLFFAQFIGVRLIGAGQTAVVMNLEPIFTIALAVLILSEPVTIHQLIGATMVITAIIAAQSAKKKNIKS